MSKIYEMLTNVTSSCYNVEIITKDDALEDRVRQELSSSSAKRFYLLLDMLEEFTLFKVFTDKDKLSMRETSSKFYRYHIVLATANGLLATTSNDFLGNGIPDETIWAVWHYGHIVINTLMHIAPIWFQKEFEHLYLAMRAAKEIKGEDTFKSASFTLQSMKARLEESSNIVNFHLDVKNSIDTAAEITKLYWASIGNKNNTTGNEVEEFVTNRPIKAEDSCKKIMNRAYNIVKNADPDFKQKLFHLLKAEECKQKLQNIDTRSFEVIVSSSCTATKELVFPSTLGNNTSKPEKRNTTGIISYHLILSHISSYQLISSYTILYHLILSHIISYITSNILFSYIILHSTQEI